MLFQGMPYLRRRLVSLDEKPLEGNDQYEGYVADLAMEVADQIDIDYIIVPVKDGRFGAKNEEDGTWNGMIGELIDGVSSCQR